MQVRIFFILAELVHFVTDQGIKSIAKLSLRASTLNKSSQWKVLVPSFSAYWDGVLFDVYPRCVISNSVFAIISSVSYFFGKKFTNCV